MCSSTSISSSPSPADSAEGMPDVYSIRLSKVAFKSTLPFFVAIEGLRWLLAVEVDCDPERSSTAETLAEEREEKDNADMGGDKGDADIELGSTLSSTFIVKRF